jgi:oligopeptidase B
LHDVRKVNEFKKHANLQNYTMYNQIMELDTDARRAKKMSRLTQDTRTIRPPRIKARETERMVHGITLNDPYAWIRAENWREILRDPSKLPMPISRYLKAENRYCADHLKQTGALQKTLFQEMRGRIKEDDAAPPQPDGPYQYYSRYRKGGQHALYCRKPRAGGRETILLDADELAKGKDYFDIGSIVHAPNHHRVAWSADEAGSELHTIRVRDIATGAVLADTISDTTGEIIWAADSASFFYVRLDAEHRPLTVCHHVLGEATSHDTVLYQESDTGFFVHIGKTQSGRFLVISIADHETGEVHVLDLSQPGGAVRLIAERRVGTEYDLDHHHDDFIILTNADAALDFKLVRAPITAPERANWRDLVAHRPGCLILSHGCLRDRLIRLERENGLPRIVIRELRSGDEHAIAFDEAAYALGLNLGLEFDTNLIRLTYASLATPAQTWDYDTVTRARVLLKTQEIPSGHDPASYDVRRIFATGHDGAQIPISLLMRRGQTLDGTAPCLLYGYGAYGSAISASFRITPLSLVDRGFVYAIAHVRGGADKGRGWYEAGKRANKPNTFHDFISCANHLIAEGYTAKGHIVAHGGSAGGMLMGAVANMAPELFGGIIADVPFVDVLNTILDDTLPLTPPEWPEWGDPIRDVAAFNLIRSYSPYDNVRAQDYPPMLVLAGLTDPRVTYWEPAKWVAKLRATMTGGGPILLKTNMEAGHGGAAGRFHSLKETALSYAFAIAVTETGR